MVVAVCIALLSIIVCVDRFNLRNPEGAETIHDLVIISNVCGMLMVM